MAKTTKPVGQAAPRGAPGPTDDAMYVATLQWLCEGDPAVRWRVERDLLGRGAEVYLDTQSEIGRRGWGAQLLALRQPSGMWGDGLYSPKWVSTFYTLRLLYWFGLDGTHPAAVESTALLLDEGGKESGGVSLWSAGWTDCCVTAMTLSLSLRFGHVCDERIDAMMDWLLSEQLPDGGWNCNRGRSGCRVSSFHTTLSVLESLHHVTASSRAGLREERPAVNAAIARGNEYFLRHHIYRSERTGGVVNVRFTEFSFPPRWYFDVLRALDYCRHVMPADDARLSDAIGLVHARRTKRGRWRAQNRHTGRVHFRLEPAGESRYNTLRALLVLKWAGQVGTDAALRSQPISRNGIGTRSAGTPSALSR